MKLSEMPTRKAAACLAELAVPVGVLAKSPEVQKYLEKAAKREANFAMLADAASVLLPVFLRDHYAETVKVISVLTGKTAAEIDEQPVKDTIADVKASVDGDLIGFFTK